MISKVILMSALLVLVPPTAREDTWSSHYADDKNVILHAEHLVPFFQQLDSLIAKRQGKVHIVQIGDSHIQADVLSGQARKRFQNTFGNGGRGFVFPYNIAKSNLPLDIALSVDGAWQSSSIMKPRAGDRFGASGYVLRAEDSSGLEVKALHAPDRNFAFDKLTVFQEFGYFVPEDSSAVRLLALGGGAEFPFATYLFNGYKDSVRLRLHAKAGASAVLNGLSLENTEPGVVYHAMGTNGSSTLQYLRAQRFEHQIAALQADLIIVSFGTNDCYLPYSRYCSSCTEDRFRQLIRRLKAQNPEASILLTVPPDHYYRRRYANRNLSYLRKAMLKLADQEGVAVWDLYSVMGGRASIREWQRAGLARRDLIHFSREGYLLQGDLLYEAVMKAYEGRYN